LPRRLRLALVKNGEVVNQAEYTTQAIPCIHVHADSDGKSYCALAELESRPRGAATAVKALEARLAEGCGIRDEIAEEREREYQRGKEVAAERDAANMAAEKRNATTKTALADTEKALAEIAELKARESLALQLGEQAQARGKQLADVLEETALD